MAAPPSPSSSPPPFTKADFLDYCRAFNRRDYAAMAAYYTADVALTLPDPSAPALHGRAAVVEHYEALHAEADETVVPVVLVGPDAGRIFYVMHAYVRRTRPGPPGRLLGYDTVGEGDVVRMKIWALYEVRPEGKIGRIECRLVDQALLGKVDLDAALEESRQMADPGLVL